MSDTQLLLTVIVKDPGSVLYEGKVNAVSTYNTFGPLDILPFHENFISIIEKEVVLHSGKDEKKFTVDMGIINVASDAVIVLLGIQTLLQPPTPPTPVTPPAPQK